MADLIQIGVVWQKNKKDGSVFFSGKMGDTASILIFNNLDKLKPGAKDNLPDYKIFITKPQPKEFVKPEDSKPQTFKNDYLSDDDIPF